MEELLLMLKIRQEQKIKQRFGYYIKERLNPYNPLSYIVFILDSIIGTVLYGVVGYWKNYRNPFKYR
ncbi:hypothetical protein [Sphingobacterium mizutaii]|uniref:hypothetical protein n=1 Tax=Sphingobacterium mizutaii TaxID=1010 RepID=UPI0028A26186|nr:hypothetical protein [Sphingobacterium mizutaii]